VWEKKKKKKKKMKKKKKKNVAPGKKRICLYLATLFQSYFQGCQMADLSAIFANFDLMEELLAE
jgi:hypothetical protein